MDLDAWLNLLDRVGWPGAFLLLLAYIARRAFNWLAPRCEKIIDGHISLMNALEANQETQTTGHKTTHSTLEKHGNKLDQIHSIVQKIPRPPSDSVPRPMP